MASKQPVPRGWSNPRLGDLVTLKNGAAFSARVWGDTGLPIIRIQNLNGSAEFNYFDGVVDERIIIDLGDMVFSWSGNRGTSFGPFIWRGARGVLNQHIFKVTVRDAVEQAFLYHAIKHITAQIEDQAHGISGLVHVRKSELEGFRVLLPPAPERRRIRAILDSIDTAIERTRAVIEQVRVVKQALLADLMTNGLPGRHKKFKTVKGLGRVPDDWEVVRLDKIAQVDRGKFAHRPRNEPRFYGGAHPFVQTGDVRVAMGWLRTYSQTLNDDGLAISRLFPRGTIIITIAANIGETAIAALDVAFPDSLIGIVPQPCVHTEYLEMYLRTRQPMLRKMATESAQANITLVDVRRVAVCLPSDDEQIQIAEMLTTLEQRELVEVEGVDQMVVLKAALSDALLTGRVRVPHAEGVATR